MSRVSALAIVAGLMCSSAFAGGIERSPQSMSLLFEEGRAFQLGFGVVSPSLSGTAGGGAVASGDMAPSYTTLSFGYKMPITESLDFALIYDQSVGADVDYSDADAGYPLNGTMATLDSWDLTALLKYRFSERMSVYGGLRAQTIVAELEGLPVPVPALYSLSADRSWAMGYVAGAAYEIPEIALRVALTYNSAIEHDFNADETFATPLGANTLPGSFTTEIPQSVNLEFQTGVAADTLLFGSIRWQDWSEFDITPENLGSPLIDYQSDYTTYTLGLGRRFSETWSGAVTVSYEGATGDIQGNLAPRDGFVSVGLGATYTQDNTSITAGLRYVELGDATTQVVGADFTGNSAVAAGVRVTQRF